MNFANWLFYTGVNLNTDTINTPLSTTLTTRLSHKASVKPNLNCYINNLRVTHKGDFPSWVQSLITMHRGNDDDILTTKDLGQVTISVYMCLYKQSLKASSSAPVCYELQGKTQNIDWDMH